MHSSKSFPSLKRFVTVPIQVGLEHNEQKQQLGQWKKVQLQQEMLIGGLDSAVGHHTMSSKTKASRPVGSS